MSAAVTVLAACSAVAYGTLIARIVRGSWRVYAGSRIVNIAALVSFALSRLDPQSTVLNIVASLVLAAALVILSRRSTVGGAFFAGLPVMVMLLTVDRNFFTGDIADAFQRATVALLCAAGPLALLYFTTTRNHSVP